MKEEYTMAVGPRWSTATQQSWDGLKQAILADPCIMRYDHRKLTILCTDFSAIGFGYVACQPADDPASVSAMNSFLTGGPFTFMRPGSTAILRPVAFGSRRSKGNETKLHSHLREGFVSPHVLWPEVCLGDGLLCDQVHP